MPQNPSNTSSSRPTEELHPTGGFERAEGRCHEDHEVSKVAEDLGGVAKAEVLGMDESVETSGRISEVLSKKKDKTSSGGSGASTASRKEIEALKLHLLEHLPSEKVMKRQVDAEIRKEIKYLRKRALGLIGAQYGSMSFFEMTNLVRKIRELNGILCSLAKMAFDGLKTLWLRFVHGIM